MPPPFNYNQQLDESELVDYLANKSPRSHKVMLISKVFNSERVYLATFVNQSLHLVELNINRCDIIIGRDFISSLGIGIHGADMTIHWDDATIPWQDIDSTTNDVFALSQYNAPLNSKNKRMKGILDAKYTKSGS